MRTTPIRSVFRNSAATFVFSLFILLWPAANTDGLAQNFWQQTNGPYGGRIQSLAINNSNGYIFAGTAGGGVFRSMDNGNSWTAVNNGFSVLVLYALVINASGHIFAGTYDGVFRSTNNGDSWTEVITGLPNFLVVSSLAINSSGHIFAGVSGGVFRSTNNGDSWTAVNNGLADFDVNTLAINASGHIFVGTAGTYVGGVFQFGGVYRSTDDGNSWMPVNSGLPNDTRDVFTLAINSSGHIFAGNTRGTAGAYHGGGVFRSIDNGNSWMEVNNGLLRPDVKALTINNASGHIFAGTGGGVFRSANNGNSWTAINNGLTDLEVYALAINASGHIFAGALVGGVFRSTNNGNSWVPVNIGLINTAVRTLAINLSGTIFAGTGSTYSNSRGLGVLRSMDNGDNWTQVNTGLTNPDIRALAINSSGHIFAGTDDGVFRSTNNGDSWTEVITGLTGTNLGIAALAINSDGHVFAGRNYGDGGVFRSTNNGDNWTPAYTGLTGNTVFALAINSSGHIFAVTSRNGVFRSTDNGDSWTAVNNGLTDLEVYPLAINSSGHIFAGMSYGGGGVFRSTNNGDSWTAVNTGLPSFPSVSALAINLSGHIFAGIVYDGIFRSTNNGDSWTAVNTGLTVLGIGSFAINSNGYIFAGTSAAGVFRSAQSTLLPLVATNAATNISPTAATLNGTVNPSGLSTTVTFQYGTTTSYGNTVTATPNPVTGTNPVSVSATLADLTPGTEYHFRAVAMSNAGTTYGTDQTFRTPALPPAVTTNAATNVTSSSAALNAKVNANGLTTTVKFQYGRTTSYGSEANAMPSPVAGIDTISVNADLTGLSPNTLYHFRAVSTNSVGTTNGANQMFTTNLASNRSPVVADTIRNQMLTVGGPSFTRNLNAVPVVFKDPDGDALSYTAISSLPNNATASISGSTLTVSPVSGGVSTITVTADDGRGGMLSTTFIVTVNRPPVVASPIANQNLTIGGAPFTRDLNTPPAIFSDPDGNVLAYSASSSAMNFATANISGTVLTVAPVTVGSATITVTANDGRGGIISTTFTATVNLPSYPSSLNLNTTVAYPSHPNASDYPATDYRIVGLPGASNRLVNQYLSGTQNKDWQVYWDNGAASNFFAAFDGSSTFQFSAGRAFWIINKGPLSVNTTVPSAPLNATQEVVIPLQSGWNLITNPFTSAIAWSKIQTADTLSEPIYLFNGSFSASSTFDPYVGYYFFNTTNRSSLKIPYSLLFSTVAATNVDPAIWRVNISLSSGEFSDKSTSFGIAPETSPDLDRLDFRKPRAIAVTPTVEFKRPEWDANYSTFATDIRPEFEASESWEFDVRAISRQPAQLAFTGIKRIPEHFEVYLIDAGRAQSANLREDSLYHFTPAAELMKFKVVVGRKENVQEQLSALALPKTFTLEQNYPNPLRASVFNPSTTISVVVPLASEIELKVYDLLGKEVKTLYHGTLAAGRYWFGWDGRNAAGSNVVSGVYLYRLNTNTGVSLLGKMILVR